MAGVLTNPKKDLNHSPQSLFNLFERFELLSSLDVFIVESDFPVTLVHFAIG
jgi:hypothetical protein